jgi:hypothetical protein
VPVTIFGSGGDEAEIELYQSLGVDRVVLRLPPRQRDEVLPVLDRYVKLLPRTR